MKTIIGGVGYHFMRDYSLGPVLTRRLAGKNWPDQVTIDADFNFGPIAIVQRFMAEPGLCNRLILFAAVDRGREPGTIYTYRWRGELPSEEEIQERIGEALMGVISLDNLLVVGEQFNIWPEEVLVVEIEPADHSWGDGFSPQIEAILDQVIDTIEALALGEQTPNGRLLTAVPGKELNPEQHAGESSEIQLE